MDGCAIYSEKFDLAIIRAGEEGSIMFFDDAEADALKACVERLKSQPESVHIDFYRDLLGGRPLCGPDGILVQMVEPDQVGGSSNFSDKLQGRG